MQRRWPTIETMASRLKVPTVAHRTNIEATALAALSSWLHTVSLAAASSLPKVERSSCTSVQVCVLSMPGLTLVSPTPKLSFFLSFFSPNIFQANLQFAAILLAQSLMCGDYGHVIPHSAQYILRGEMMIVLQFLKFFLNWVR